ncbi:Alcohol dehydrogenase-like 2 [Nymphaea thermarum]|nr:Alcohol dehydrogenase-like 2 [Nymphaea thermarum]
MATKGKTIRCKGAVCWKRGEPLVIEEVDVAPPQPSEVRIKIICTSLCHTDVTFWTLPVTIFTYLLPPISLIFFFCYRTAYKAMEEETVSFYPSSLTHSIVLFALRNQLESSPEFSAMRPIVESVGEGVREFKEGDMVVPSLLADCEECVDCKSEKSNMCATFPFSPLRTGMPRNGSSRLSTASGQQLHHFLNVSSFVEYTVLDVTHLVKVDPADVPPEKACLLGCGVSTGVGAAWRAAGVEKGSKVAIFGLGSIGLAVAEGARLRGASQIIGVDLNPDKHEIGGGFTVNFCLFYYNYISVQMRKKFGITDFIDPKECGDKSLSQVWINLKTNLGRCYGSTGSLLFGYVVFLKIKRKRIVQVVKELTGGGADYCFECVGLASLMSEAYSSSRPGRGKTVILGVEMKGAPFCIGAGELLQGRTVVGSLFGGVKPKTDIPNFARLYKRKVLSLSLSLTYVKLPAMLLNPTY